jgi:aryl-alcohol dehydrogenase-like predicted oxidoreductase
LTHALQETEIVCVQNEFNLGDRSSQPVLDECARRGIAFVPFAPLGFGSTSVLDWPGLPGVSKQLKCTPAQVCLAWLLAMSPAILLIPGTSSVRHLEENVAADLLELDEWAMQEISRL